jgi:hypothetical protein
MAERSCESTAVCGASIAAMLRRAFKTGIEEGESNRRSHAHLSCWAVTLQQVQFLETFENPEGEIDIDAERIKNLALKLVRQSFA